MDDHREMDVECIIDVILDDDLDVCIGILEGCHE
jgi:hypothetical protein